MDSSLLLYREYKEDSGEEDRIVGAIIVGVLSVAGTVIGGVYGQNEQDEKRKLQEKEARDREEYARKLKEIEEMKIKAENDRIEREKQEELQRKAEKEALFKKRLPYYILGGLGGVVVLIVIIVLITTKPAS